MLSKYSESYTALCEGVPIADGCEDPDELDLIGAFDASGEPGYRIRRTSRSASLADPPTKPWRRRPFIERHRPRPRRPMEHIDFVERVMSGRSRDDTQNWVDATR